MLNCIYEPAPFEGYATHNLDSSSRFAPHGTADRRSRRVNLRTVVSEALSHGLRNFTATERSEQVLRAYQRAFTGFSEREMLILVGVLPHSSIERG